MNRPSIPGSYQQSIGGHRTFIPAPLPPRLNLPPAVLRRLENATHLLGQVEMCRTLLPNADLLIYSSLQREALASSTIEGTIASPAELVLFQVSQQADRQATREVANYATALEWGVAEIARQPITDRLILGLHGILLQAVRGQANAGRYKIFQNAIGSNPSDTFENAVYMPPPPERTVELMNSLELYINQDNPESKVVQCALAHYQFETIHPFSDGNGRVGRLLIVLQMILLGLLSAPLIYPSVYFERTRQDYYQHLQDVREKGAWNEWINYFAMGIIRQCQETIQFTHSILSLRKRLHEEIAHVSRRAALNAVLNVFFEEPVLGIREISRRANMAYNSVQSAIVLLEERGIVVEMTGKQYSRVYACIPVMRAIFGEDAPTQGAGTR